MACSPLMERAQKSVEAAESCSWWRPRMSAASGTHHEPDTRTIDVAAPHTMAPIIGDLSEMLVHSKNMLTGEDNQKKYTACITTSPRTILDGWRLASN